MKKIFKFNDKTEVELSNSVGWTMEYRDQFGHDILPDLLPILSALITLIKEVKDTADLKDAIKTIDNDTIQEAMIQLVGLQFVDFINMLWAMAKDADDKTPLPKRWVKQFDEGFFLDKIAPEVFTFILEGFISSKNLPGLPLAGTEK